jgi:hypothetical protein
VQSGPPRYELLNEVTPGLFSASVSYDQAQLQVFDAWFKSVIFYGALSFNMDLLIGEGVTTHECNIQGTPKRTQNGQRWDVSFVLVATQIEYPADCLAEDLAFIGASMIPTENTTLCQLVTNTANLTLVDIPNAWGNLKYGTDYS